MKTTLKLEELGMFVLGIYLFSELHFSWWWFLVLILTPDVSMLGYIVNSKIGGFTYNLFHHKGIAILVYLLGIYFNNQLTQLFGLILFSHASFDRIFGYGLKYSSSFHDTHLGKIGKNDRNFNR